MPNRKTLAMCEALLKKLCSKLNKPYSNRFPEVGYQISRKYGYYTINYTNEHGAEYASMGTFNRTGDMYAALRFMINMLEDDHV